MEQHALLHGEVIVRFAVTLVGNANLELIESGEHVELGERNVGKAIDLGRITRDNRVEPTAATLAARGHAIFVALGAQQIAIDGILALAAVFGIHEFRGERTGANARDIGLLNAEHAIDGRGANARTSSSATRAARRARDERIGAVVDVEQRALRALEQNMLALAQRVVEQLSGFGHMRTNDFSEGQIGVANLVDGERTLAVHLLENGILHLEGSLDLHAEHMLVEQVLDANAAASGLVLVARADAAVGGADFVFAQTELGRLVELNVVGHDHVSIARDLQALARKAFAFEHAHFLNENLRVHHNAVADDRHGLFIHNA